ncbi:cell wall integrity and stress response component [Coccidioides immitis RS]|uniref:Cell wall integrity and stress response component n=1 Tax=Coccidioides immitis (strain RS) TaxID=246410 RepID=J3KJY0_COCIM|nr:cell wall integrity and stress response component [Coccidioides immitis RS]EAS36435.3 cell wall integrity and stress response component [Coccidioides immitis RS]
MRSLLSVAAIAASILLHGGLVGAADDINKETSQGCYKSSGSMKSQGPYTFQSVGYCRGVCEKLKKPAMALSKGSHCYCGDKLPPKSQKTDDDDCKITCDGYPKEYCGGKKTFSVFNTERNDEVESDDDSVLTATGTSTSPPMQTITQSGHTVVVTAGGDADKKGGGPNKAGIAAGVVVGVVVLAAIIGGIFFFLKYKKRKEVMEEYRRNATISNFVAGGKPYSEGSMSDSRLEPSLMSQRRQSNGSIADDQDFSRRILKVTNPDSHY